MLQKEFEERTGFHLTPALYAEVEKMYMETDMDKDEFCKEYKKDCDSKLLNFFYTQYCTVQNQLKSITGFNAREKVSMARFLIDEAQAYSDGKLLDKADELIGYAEVIKYKLEKGYKLWKRDIEYIKENIK